MTFGAGCISCPRAALWDESIALPFMVCPVWEIYLVIKVHYRFGSWFSISLPNRAVYAENRMKEGGVL